MELREQILEKNHGYTSFQPSCPASFRVFVHGVSKISVGIIRVYWCPFVGAPF